MTTNPYELLGVDRTATKDEIKKAYYDRAKQHHPDAGGSEDDFVPLKLAYETLMDDAKRAFFDKYGALADSKEGKEIHAARQGLIQFFLEVLDQTGPESLKRLDLVGHLRRKLEQEQKKCNEGLKLLEQKEKQLQQTEAILAEKLKNSDPKQPNFFQESVQAALAQCAAQRMIVTTSISVQNRALEMLKSFTFDFEQDFAAPLGYRGVFSTTSTMGGWSFE